MSLSKERLEFDQRTQAQTDPLTGSLNRRAFMWRGMRLLQRHAYERAPLCLLFLDLDHFKSLNDRFGHSGGDDVLTSFVGARERLHPSDAISCSASAARSSAACCRTPPPSRPTAWPSASATSSR